jgi:hypothetical protein
MAYNTGAFTEIITSQFEAVRTYASEASDLAISYVDDLRNIITKPIDTKIPTIRINPPSPVRLDPTLIGELPPVPTDWPDAPPDVATADYFFPPELAYRDPGIPSLSYIVIPGFVDGVIPPLVGKMPVSNIIIPTFETINNGGLYEEDGLVQAAKTKLTNNIVYGGTMINPTVEADLWNRDRERREQALRDAKDKIMAHWSKLNWTLPDGLLSGMLLAVENEYMNKDLDASRDIAIKQADLEQKGMFESLKLGIDLENTLINNFNEYAKRVYEASKTTVDVTIQILKSQIDLYNSQLQAFKTSVEAYKISIEAELARVEVFKTKMLAAQIGVDIDKNRTQLYIAQLEGIAKRIDAYKTTVQAVGIKYEAEKVKIEGYKARVDVFTSKNDVIVKKFMSQVDLFKGFVEAYKASASVQTEMGNMEQKGQIAVLDATLKAWEVQLNVTTEDVKVRLQALETAAKTTSNLAAGAMAAGHAAVSLSGQAALEGG